MGRTPGDPMAKTYARLGRRDAAAGFRQPEAAARYGEIEARLVEAVRACHRAYVDIVHAIDAQILQIEAALTAPAPPSVGAAQARGHADRARQEKEREALLAKRDAAHLQLLDDVLGVQRRARTWATAYWSAHREHRRDGEPGLDEPPAFDVDDIHLAPVPALSR